MEQTVASSEPHIVSEPMQVIAVGEGTWAKDKTEDAALKGLKSLGWRGDRYLIYHVHPETTIDSYGSFVTPYEGYIGPVLVARVRKVNRRWQREEVK